MTTEALSPTSISITFYPPPEIDQNGPITLYNISYLGEIFDTVTHSVNTSFTNPIYPAVSPVFVNITRLQEYNNYTVRVRAMNKIGGSELTTGVIQMTVGAGRIYYLNNYTNSPCLRQLILV